MNRPTVDIARLQEAVGHVFSDVALLMQALTHTSFSNESPDPVQHNERLEFLGDAVINTVVAIEAYRRFPDADEGVLTRLKAVVVARPSLARQAEALNLGEYLRLGRGAASQDEVSAKASVLSDAFEALVGALFIDGGFAVAEAFISAHLAPELDRVKAEHAEVDAKTALQIACLKQFHEAPLYEITDRCGPSHDPMFTIRVVLPQGTAFEARAGTRKAAEQAAAALALEGGFDPTHTGDK